MDCRSKGAISRIIVDRVPRFTLPQSRHFQQISRKKSAALPRTVALRISELVQRGRADLSVREGEVAADPIVVLKMN
jgi:hypothetical protein